MNRDFSAYDDASTPAREFQIHALPTGFSQTKVTCPPYCQVNPKGPCFKCLWLYKNGFLSTQNGSISKFVDRVFRMINLRPKRYFRLAVPDNWVDCSLEPRLPAVLHTLMTMIRWGGRWDSPGQQSKFAGGS
ncbi:hypothetical protein BC937DRAFT_88020 [Endogone sp. FLAS-F59071]|nr:hypothetical protein BC937DRAFT_88020 [Endogone sp. FLAS-F59071]|eukprot:RUS19079.1 hypothetical protein BC937DRAFT_88020 [Endogone sp. FLAS-F59071]